MYKAIHHDGRKPLVDIASYLQRHDIVYRRPSLEPFEGLPLGDGRLGGLLSHTANGLAMQVNHTDVIDFGPDGNMQAWAWEAEERNTAPVACGTVAIQSALPCFDWVYLKEYEERLSLADGCVYGRAVTPFSRVEWKAYAANGQGALVFKVDAWQQEPAAWTITLERWPSPNFFHHYEQVVPLYDKNLAAVSAKRCGVDAEFRDLKRSSLGFEASLMVNLRNYVVHVDMMPLEVDPGTGAVVFTRRCGSDQMWSADQRKYLRSADLEGLLVTYRGMLDVFYARFFGMLSRASSADLRECRGEIGAVNRRVGFELVRFDPFAEARERLAEA